MAGWTGTPGASARRRKVPLFWLWLAIAALPRPGSLYAQEPQGFEDPLKFPPTAAPLPAQVSAASPPQDRPWKEGAEIRLRVPVASETHEVMSAVLFPETGIRSAITGWGESTLTSIQKGNTLFLRLSRQAQGQLSVIGESGTHYLLYLEAVDAKAPGGYDAFVKITRPVPAAQVDAASGGAARKVSRADRPRPKGALDLLRAMRLGEPRENTRILRAKGEIVFSSPDIELRLLYLYQAPSYTGRIYEVRNLSGRALALDASRFAVSRLAVARLKAEGDDLILCALRENVVPPGGSTRLYGIFWRS